MHPPVRELREIAEVCGPRGQSALRKTGSLPLGLLMDFAARVVCHSEARPVLAFCKPWACRRQGK